MTSARYGFVVHPLSRLHLVVQRLWRLGRGAGLLKRFPPILTRFARRVDGLVYGVPLLPRALLGDQERSVQAIRGAVDALAERGARAVGLGALCAVVGSRGRAIAEGAPVPVTTGHELTAWAAWRTLERSAALIGAAADEPVAVLGAPSVVAVAVAELVAASGRPVLLGVRGKGSALGRIEARSPPVRCVPATEATSAARLVVSASSGGGVLVEAALRPGSLVVDVARPRDLTGPRRRTDVQSVDGEMVALPPGTRVDLITRLYSRLVGQAGGHVFACFVAPMLIAAGGDPPGYPTARFLDPMDVRRWGALAEHHGFHVHDLFDRGRRLTPAALRRFGETRRAQAL